MCFCGLLRVAFCSVFVVRCSFFVVVVCCLLSVAYCLMLIGLSCFLDLLFDGCCWLLDVRCL